MNASLSRAILLLHMLTIGSFASLANAQSALSTKAGLGYSGLGYVFDDVDGVGGVDFVHGTQIDFGMDLSLGQLFTVGVDADFTVAEAGRTVVGRNSFNISDIGAVLDDNAAQHLTGSFFSVSALVGMNLGDFHPATGIGFMHAEIEDAQRADRFDFNCMTWIAKPLDVDVAKFINFAMEYEQTLACDVDASALSLSGRITF